MKFDVTQQFDASADEVVACYSSEELYRSLPEFGRISRPEVLARTVDGSKVVVRLRYRFTAELPTAALAIIDPDRLTWVEETTYDLAARTARVRLLPDHYASKLAASATVAVTDRPGGGSVRRVTGELKVKVLLVGGQVEKAIVEGLTEHLEEEARLVVARL